MSETLPDDSDELPDDSSLQRFEREKADSDGWKQRSNFYEQHSDWWETWGEVTHPRVKTTIEELGAALRPLGEPVIDDTLNISESLSIQTRQLLRGLRAIKNEMLVTIVETGERFRYSESRNLWIQILDK